MKIICKSKISIPENFGREIQIVFVVLNKMEPTSYNSETINSLKDKGYSISSDLNTVFIDYKKSNYGLIAKVSSLVSFNNIEMLAEFIHQVKLFIIEDEITNLVHNLKSE